MNEIPSIDFDSIEITDPRTSVRPTVEPKPARDWRFWSRLWKVTCFVSLMAYRFMNFLTFVGVLLIFLMQFGGGVGLDIEGLIK